MALKKNTLKEITSELQTDNDGSNDNVASSIIKIENMATPLWGGISSNPNEFIQKVTFNISTSRRIFATAIESIRAQMRAHIKRDTIPGSEGKQLIDALDKIKKEIVDNKLQFKQNTKDIYQAIDQRVAEIAPEAFKWFGIGRAASNQIAGDHKLWTREALDSIDTNLQNLQASLIDKAEENVKTMFPGNMHSQLTQPVSFGHHLLAYVEMFGRDRSRIKDAGKRLNESPYGSGEISGNSYNMNREMISRILGFNNACHNSVDAITSRDYLIEFLSIAANISTTISRLATEMIHWHSTQSRYISFSDVFVNQNQVIPYRRDPEALEIIRGTTGKIYGALNNVLTSLKGLPLEFSSDHSVIMDDVFTSYDTLLNNIKAMSALVADFKINRKQMKEAAVGNFSTAIDLVDWIVNNTSYDLEQAREVSCKIIEYSIKKNKKLSLLELDEIKKIDQKITEDVYSVLIPSRAMISRRSGNGSNPVQIRKFLRKARRNFL
jgi:argininosuccinate lyase